MKNDVSAADLKALEPAPEALELENGRGILFHAEASLRDLKRGKPDGLPLNPAVRSLFYNLWLGSLCWLWNVYGMN